LKERDLTEKNYDQVLEKVADMDSDHYKLTVLKEVTDSRMTKNQMLSVLKSAKTIDSDYYKSEILRTLCRNMDDADADVKKLYRDVARSIESDTYYGRVARCID
jgi:hypothetical protein